jgi:hypothetical protein
MNCYPGPRRRARGRGWADDEKPIQVPNPSGKSPRLRDTPSGTRGYQGLVGTGVRRLAADAVTGQAAVVVTAARGHQAEIVSQGEQPSPFGI